MKLLVDGRPLLPIAPGLGPTGVGRWTAGVLKGLADVAPEWDITVGLVTREAPDLDVGSFGPRASLRSARWPERWFRRATFLGLQPPVARALGPADVMLGPDFVTWRGPFAELPVIHDLAFVRFPGSVQRKNLIYLRRLVPRVLRRAAGVVTVSETMRAEISDHFGFERERIFVVPNGCDPTEPTGASGFDPGYLLSVGTLEPRKNLGRLLDAYEVLRSRRPDIPPLVVAGGPGWRNAGELAARIAAVPGVTALGYVPDERLAALYRDASALVFPSLYEGFGLPVVEAMAAGLPVVTSDRGALGEVAGDAALFVDPLDPEAIAAGIDRILDDAPLRARLADAGRLRAQGFTWTGSGAALLAALEAAAAA